MKTKTMKAGELRISMFCNRRQVEQIINLLQEDAQGSILAYKFAETELLKFGGGEDDLDEIDDPSNEES